MTFRWHVRSCVLLIFLWEPAFIFSISWSSQSFSLILTDSQSAVFGGVNITVREPVQVAGSHGRNKCLFLPAVVKRSDYCNNSQFTMAKEAFLMLVIRAVFILCSVCSGPITMLSYCKWLGQLYGWPLQDIWLAQGSRGVGQALLSFPC